MHHVDSMLRRMYHMRCKAGVLHTVCSIYNRQRVQYAICTLRGAYLAQGVRPKSVLSSVYPRYVTLVPYNTFAPVRFTMNWVRCASCALYAMRVVCCAVCVMYIMCAAKRVYCIQYEVGSVCFAYCTSHNLCDAHIAWRTQYATQTLHDAHNL